jgi:hypothetical protein
MMADLLGIENFHHIWIVSNISAPGTNATRNFNDGALVRSDQKQGKGAWIDAQQPNYPMYIQVCVCVCAARADE